MFKKLKRNGFTLIELVVVIAVLGILAGIAIPRFMEAQASARGAKILANLRALDSAAGIYMMQNGKIPTIAELVEGDSKLITVAEGYYEGTFRIVKNNGMAQEYDHQGAYGIDTTTGRAYLKSTTNTVDYYLGAGGSKGTVGDYMPEILAAMKAAGVIGQDMDSTALEGDNTFTTAFLTELAKAGLSMDALGATSWRYTKDGVLSWTTEDIASLTPGTDSVVTMSYRTTGNWAGLYSVWVSQLETKTGTQGKYVIISNANRKEVAASAALTQEQKKDQATVQAIYEQAGQGK